MIMFVATRLHEEMNRLAVYSYLIWYTYLRFYKGFTNLRERTSRFRHFYLARRTQMLSSFGYWEPLHPFNDLKVHQNITIQIP